MRHLFEKRESRSIQMLVGKYAGQGSQDHRTRLVPKLELKWRLFIPGYAHLIGQRDPGLVQADGSDEPGRTRTA